MRLHTDYLTVHKRGEDAWDICDDKGRIAPVRQRFKDGLWIIRSDNEGGTAVEVTDETFATAHDAIAHVFKMVLA